MRRTIEQANGSIFSCENVIDPAIEKIAQECFWVLVQIILRRLSHFLALMGRQIKPAFAIDRAAFVAYIFNVKFAFGQFNSTRILMKARC